MNKQHALLTTVLMRCMRMGETTCSLREGLQVLLAEARTSSRAGTQHDCLQQALCCLLDHAGNNAIDLPTGQ